MSLKPKECILSEAVGSRSDGNSVPAEKCRGKIWWRGGGRGGCHPNSWFASHGGKAFAGDLKPIARALRAVAVVGAVAAAASAGEYGVCTVVSCHPSRKI